MPRSAWIAFASLTSLCVALVAVGCGKPATTEGSTPSEPAKGGAATAAASPSTEKASIQAKGSDTLLQVAQALAEAYKKVEPNVDVAVTGGGSGTGFKAILDGTADIADASRKINNAETASAKERGLDLVENLVGYDGIAVIVNKDNPVEKLAIDELGAIFTAETTDWAVFGGKGKVVLLSRDTSSGTHEYFKEHVLNKGDSKGPRDFAASAIMEPSNDQIRTQVAATAGAIGYIGLGYVDDSVKIVPVVGKDDKPVAASVAAVKDGTYPISRPLFMYTNRDASPAVAKYIDWIKGPDGQKIVGDQGFVPL